MVGEEVEEVEEVEGDQGDQEVGKGVDDPLSPAKRAKSAKNAKARGGREGGRGRGVEEEICGETSADVRRESTGECPTVDGGADGAHTPGWWAISSKNQDFDVSIL